MLVALFLKNVSGKRNSSNKDTRRICCNININNLDAVLSIEKCEKRVFTNFIDISLKMAIQEAETIAVILIFQQM